MPSALAKEDPYYTYADYLEWDEDFRAEIIDGELFMMAPPVRKHQGVAMELSRQISNFLQGKSCKIYAAPFGVRLRPAEDRSDDTVVEPDISVICDSSKLDDRGCNGAPDLVIEILSPTTARHDLIVKFRKYLEAGVREYWIVDPDSKSVQVFILENGRYIASSYGVEPEAPANPTPSADAVEPKVPSDADIVQDTVPVTVLPGCVIDLKDVFAE